MWKQHFPSPCQKKGLWTRRWKRCDVHFVHGSPVNYDILYLSTKTQNMHETAIPMGRMLHTFLAIHGRCKFIIFLRGQTPSLSAPTLILSLMEHFEGKAKNTVKYSVKSTFCRSIQINCNWLPGNPQPLPYIYMWSALVLLAIVPVRCRGLLAAVRHFLRGWVPQLLQRSSLCDAGAEFLGKPLVEKPKPKNSWLGLLGYIIINIYI